MKVELKPDKNVTPGKFKVHPLMPNLYRAHPDTIKALKRDICVLESDPDEFADEIVCEGCQQKWDRQFWLYCPACGRSFPS